MITRVNKKYFLYTALILIYYEWLLIISEAASNSVTNVMTGAYPDGVSTLATVQNELPPVYHRIKSMIESVIIDNNHEYKYDQHDYEKDKIVITDILLNIWLQDNCLLSNLIRVNYDFQIAFLSNHPQFVYAHNDAFFDSKNNMLVMPAKIHEHLTDNTFQKVAHELQHAVDSFNNLFNGYCLDEKSRRAMPYLHSRYTFYKNCLSDIKARGAVLDLFLQDFQRINRMLLSLSKDSEYLTKIEKHDIKRLSQFIKVHQYTVMPAELHLDATTAQNIESKFKSLNYSYDVTSQRYTYTDAIYIDELPVSYQKYNYNLSIHMTDYTAKKRIATVYLVNPNTLSLRDLMQDILLNVVRLIITTQDTKTDDEFLFEVSAYLAGFMTAYAKPVQFKHEVTTLRNWLFPNFYAHEKTRYSKPHADCKNEQLSNPKLRAL